MSVAETKTAPSKQKTRVPKFIEKYYADLKELAYQNVMHELGIRAPIHALLLAAGKEHGWTLIGEQSKKVNG